METASKQSQKKTLITSLIYKGMKEITHEDYIRFLQTHDFVGIENVKVPLIKNHIISEYEPEEFKLETTTVWSFPEENSKSKNDFKVRTIYEPEKLKFYTPKHAHFAIDFYGKLCHNPEKAEKVFRTIIDVWQGKSVKDILAKYLKYSANLPGYDLDYILYALKWILEQEVDDMS